jgi:hypothetical protein
MINAWRSAFHHPTLPFGIITQETQGEPQTLDNFLPLMVDEGNYVREVHYQTFLKLRRAGDKTIGYASSFDLHRAWYHPQIKVPVGERIAAWALATQYDKPIRWLPPQLMEVSMGDGKIVLQLDTWAGPFHDGPIQGFAIAGSDGRFQPASAEWLDRNSGQGEPNWDRTRIVLSSPSVPEPLYFRYAWARNPLENLKSTDNTGLPFDTQRNDTWSLADMYQNYTGKPTRTPQAINDAEIRELMRVLRDEDLKRQIEAAKEFKCSVCQEMKHGNQFVPVAATTPLPSAWEAHGLDVAEITDHQAHFKCKFLLCVDLGMKLISVRQLLR